jgi:1-pyrroline-5-carboxylate dehydrogenase
LTVLASRDFAGLHFTGSTHVFKDIWAKIGTNIHHYKTYPRIVGKLEERFHHHTLVAQNKFLLVCVVHLNFKVKMFSSFKSLCSTKFMARLKNKLSLIKSMKMGSPEDFSNFVTVIHEGSFDKLASFIDQAKKMLMLKSSLETTISWILY